MVWYDFFNLLLRICINFYISARLEKCTFEVKSLCIQREIATWIIQSSFVLLIPIPFVNERLMFEIPDAPKADLGQVAE